MPLCTIEEAIEDIRQGRMVIMVDDEDRENEGDLVVAAENTTPEIINFMAKHGRGLICLAMEPAMIDRLELPLMAQSNQSKFGTNFTVSIEAREGVTTGISAFDRSHTILTAVADGVKPNDIVTPGHVFPCARAAAACWCAPGRPRAAWTSRGWPGASPLASSANQSATMARWPGCRTCRSFARSTASKFCSVSDLIKHRMKFGGKA
jgi:3,4-dihydroxy 2-butanone 4-phosphate synthase/GTP cyclohydrolase II